MHLKATASSQMSSQFNYKERNLPLRKLLKGSDWKRNSVFVNLE